MTGKESKITIKFSIDSAEKLFLIVIAGFTVVAMGQEILLLIENRKVELKDLLLMFIYAKVLGHAGSVLQPTATQWPRTLRSMRGVSVSMRNRCSQPWLTRCRTIS